MDLSTYMRHHTQTHFFHFDITEAYMCWPWTNTATFIISAWSVSEWVCNIAEVELEKEGWWNGICLQQKSRIRISRFLHNQNKTKNCTCHMQDYISWTAELHNPVLLRELEIGSILLFSFLVLLWKFVLYWSSSWCPCPAHGKGIGTTRWCLRSLPTQAVLWIYDYGVNFFWHCTCVGD